MGFPVLVLIIGMAAFAVVSGLREINLYKRYITGETQYLVSKRRRNRRLLTSTILILEATLLFLGFFVLDFADPISALAFWIPPLMLIIFLVYLSLLDFRETSREIDHIMKEAFEIILRKAQENAAIDKPN